MALDLRNLSVRTVSGLVYVGVLIGSIVLGPNVFTPLAGVLAAVAAYEIESNTVKRDNPSKWTVTWALDAVTLIMLMFSEPWFGVPEGPSALMLWILLVLLRFIAQIFINQRNPLKSIAIFAFEQFYIGIPLLLMVWVVSLVHNPWIVICALAMIWINDTGAYLVGSAIGRNRMFPSLSPKKSWEGFFGGLIFNIGAAFIFFYCFRLTGYTILNDVIGWIYIGICVTVFATLGDLFESMLKRSLGIKDFGHLIPGHGGVLDRIDSLLFVVPFVLVAVLFSNIMLN